MARQHTYDRQKKKADKPVSLIDSILDEGVPETKEVDMGEVTPTVDRPVPASIEKENISKPKTEATKKSEEDTDSFKPTFSIGKSEKKQKLFLLDEEIADAIDSITKDKKGNPVKGAKGINSQIANNGIIRELVSIGVLPDSYLSKIKDY